jgi:hypothetical protein
MKTRRTAKECALTLRYMETPHATHCAGAPPSPRNETAEEVWGRGVNPLLALVVDLGLFGVDIMSVEGR